MTGSLSSDKEATTDGTATTRKFNQILTFNDPLLQRIPWRQAVPPGRGDCWFTPRFPAVNPGIPHPSGQRRIGRTAGVQAISRAYLKSASEQYYTMVEALAAAQGIPVVQPPKDFPTENLRRRRRAETPLTPIKSRSSGSTWPVCTVVTGKTSINLVRRAHLQTDR
jgi:hypothetical protein